MTDVVLYSTGYGQILQIRTWLAELESATSISIDLRQHGVSPAVNVSLPATLVTTFPAGTADDPILPTEYAVETIIALDWTDHHIGRWTGQVHALFLSSHLIGKPFTLEVKSAPTGA